MQIKTILEIEGYSVLVAANGKEAFAAVHSGAPLSLVLLDMMMPVMISWESLGFLRGNALASQIPVVIGSAYGEIAKPIQFKTLLNTIEKLSA